MKSKPLETLLYSAVGVAAMAIIVIAGNIVTSAFKQRIDLTKEQAYTLSPGTRAILKKLDTTVKVRLYVTQGDASSPETVFLRGYARKIEDLLAEYRQAANGKLVVEKLDPQPDSDAEDSARLDGVEGEMLQNGEKFYLGLSVSIIDSKQAIPFLAPNRERQLEYDLSRAITRVVSPDKPVVGIMSPMPVFGAPSNPMMARMGQQGSQPWALVTELKNDFSVKSVPMDSEKIDDDVKVLIVIHPRDIKDNAQYAIDQFVLRGGKLIAYLDPLPLIDSKEQNQMFGSIPNSGSNLEKLMKSWGFALDTSKVVADLNYKMQLGGRNGQPQEAPAFLSVTADGINGDDIVTSQIDNIWLPFAGAITGTPVAGLTMTPLIKSTKQSQLVDGFMANLSGENVIKEFKLSLTEYILGMRLKGKFKTAFPGGKPGETNAPAGLKESAQENNVIVFADADMLFDNFAMRQVQSPFGNMAMAMNGNLNMAQNAVEQLAGDNNLIGVRSRAVQNRPFTVVKKMQAEAESNYRSKIKDMEESLAETQRQLSELQQKKEKGQRFILSPEQQAALETFRKKESDVKIKLKEERKQLRHDIDALETRLKWFNIAAMPLLVSLSGIGLAMFKRKKTAAR
ncbi:MAG: Gldg family protein [Verrucomicrobia bacterium]|nr:Gldg family protein [Verrucomicrobiota bacterium]